MAVATVTASRICAAKIKMGRDAEVRLTTRQREALQLRAVGVFGALFEAGLKMELFAGLRADRRSSVRDFPKVVGKTVLMDFY